MLLFIPFLDMFMLFIIYAGVLFLDFFVDVELWTEMPSEDFMWFLGV